MKALFKSEFARYQTYAGLFCLAQIMLWVFVAKVALILEPGSTKNIALMLSVVFAGFGFAILAMSLHRRKNHWAWLMHRPMTASKIHSAISGAHLALLFIGFVLPFTATVTFLDIFTNNVVELRHYLFCLHMMIVVSVAYFCGCFAVLHHSKAAFLAIWSVTYLILRQSSPLINDLLTDFLFLAATYYLARSSFKVDLSKTDNKSLAIILSAVIIQPAVVLLIVATQAFYYHIPLMAMGEHPDDDLTLNAYSNFNKKDTDQQFSHLLNLSNNPQAKALERQMELAEFTALQTRNRYSDIKHQLFVKDNQFALIDGAEGNLWVFSHQLMVYVGRNVSVDEFKGYLGRRGFIEKDQQLTEQDRFIAVPGTDGQRFITDGNRLLAVDFTLKELTLRHQIEPTDVYVAAPEMAFDKLWLKTQKALHIVDATDFTQSHAEVASEHVINHPVDSNRHLGIKLSEVPEGFLVLYASYHLNGYAQGGAQLSYIKHDGDKEILAQTEFESLQVPSWLYHQQFILSPFVLNLLDGSIGTILQMNSFPPKGSQYFWQQGQSNQIIGLSVLLALISAVLTWILSARKALNTRTRGLWTTMNLILSLPGLLAFVLYHRSITAKTVKGVEHV